jgi:hypothetical protein
MCRIIMMFRILLAYLSQVYIFLYDAIYQMNCGNCAKNNQIHPSILFMFRDDDFVSFFSWYNDRIVVSGSTAPSSSRHSRLYLSLHVLLLWMLLLSHRIWFVVAVVVVVLAVAVLVE